MAVTGQVREWHRDDGWGVLDSSETPGGCWAHFSHLLVEGYSSLRTGQSVEFTFERGEQDGYDFRAVEVWPAGKVPVRPPPPSGPGPAYSSSLRITLEPQPEPPSTEHPSTEHPSTD